MANNHNSQRERDFSDDNVVSNARVAFEQERHCREGGIFDDGENQTREYGYRYMVNDS